MKKVLSRVSARGWQYFFVTALVVAALDQLTKMMILRSFQPGDTLNVIPGFFNLVLTFNLGAAFGMLSDLADGTRQTVLLFTTLVALLVVFYFLLFEYREDRIGQVALGMIFGGAVGNIIDRARIGMVVDFLDVYIGSAHWPAFNIADSSICIAVAILILHRPKAEN